MYEYKNGPVKLVGIIEPTYKGRFKIHKTKKHKVPKKINKYIADYIIDKNIGQHLNDIF